MQLINSSNNQYVDISLYFSNIDNNITNNKNFIEMISLVEQNPNKYIYAIYGDNNLIKNNIYIPVFHTTYLACKKHNIILDKQDDDWLIDVFPNNNYYMICDPYETKKEIKFISSIKDIK